VVGPDGEPLAGVTVYGLIRFGQETLKGAEFSVRGVNPRANRPLVFYHKAKNLGLLVKEWRSQADGPLKAQLQPCGSVSGRVMEDGQPVAGLRIDLWGMGPGGVGFHCDEKVVITDNEGRFRVEGLVPGQTYRVDPLRAHVAVEAGKHKDMGDLKR
jgi:hypothetical protein